MIYPYLDARSSPNWENCRTYHTLDSDERSIVSSAEVGNVTANLIVLQGSLRGPTNFIKALR
jgi:hypothetical protein